MGKKHENINLLFFLNAVLGSVLDGLVGTFEMSAKYKFNKVVNCVNELEKDVLRNCTESAHQTYADSVEALSIVLNKFMDSYNKGNISELMNYIGRYEEEFS